MNESKGHTIITVIVSIMVMVGFVGGSIAIYEHVIDRGGAIELHDDTTNDDK